MENSIELFKPSTPPIVENCFSQKVFNQKIFEIENRYHQIFIQASCIVVTIDFLAMIANYMVALSFYILADQRDMVIINTINAQAL